MSELKVHDLGHAPYGPTLELQMKLVEQAKASDDDPAWLLLVEHDPPVITLGRRGSEDDFNVPRSRLEQMGVEIFESSRGGEVTYHGPGQQVGYAIIRVDRRGKDVKGHVKKLEESIIRLLAEYDIQAGRKEGFTGVWIGEEKIAAIGVAVSRWVTYHGFALNVSTDMSYFDLFVPCGIRDKGVTSMQKLLGRDISVDEIKPRLIEIFAEVFGFDKTIEADPLA